MLLEALGAGAALFFYRAFKDRPKAPPPGAVEPSQYEPVPNAAPESADGVLYGAKLPLQHTASGTTYVAPPTVAAPVITLSDAFIDILGGGKPSPSITPEIEATQAIAANNAAAAPLFPPSPLQVALAAAGISESDYLAGLYGGMITGR